MKGTKTCVISIDNAEEPKIKSKIPQISLLNNFRFNVDSVIARRAYQIGCGDMNGFEVLEEFPSHAVDVGQVCVRVRNPNIQNEM